MNTQYRDFNPLSVEPDLKKVHTRSFCLAENTEYVMFIWLMYVLENYWCLFWQNSKLSGHCIKFL